MKEKSTILLFIIMVCAILIVPSSYAERKKSLFGTIVNNVKEGAKAAKKDLDNYNTFIITLDIKNNRGQDNPVDIFTVDLEQKSYGRKAHPKEQIFSMRIPPRSSRTEKIELKAYPTQRHFMIRVYIQGHKYDDYVFNPAKQDYFRIEL